jgi:hypothetical protein
MKLAWFRARDTRTPDALDPTAALIAQLQADHDIDIITEAHAHDFVVRHFRAPYDQCVFELDDSAAHGFIWAYLIAYGGIALIRSPWAYTSREQDLWQRQRVDESIDEAAFVNRFSPPDGHSGEWVMLRVPILASQLAVVPCEGVARALQDEHGTRVQYAPPAFAQPARRARAATEDNIVFGALTSDNVPLIEKVIGQAAGEPWLLVASSAAAILERADVVIALRAGGAAGCAQLAIAAMAAGIPVVSVETAISADWPALDPQTWRPRIGAAGSPAAVTIDARDEMQSLSTAVKRLTHDAGLRDALAAGGRQWWERHARADVAAAAWRRILRDAPPLGRPSPPAGWPAHLRADATRHARGVLGEFGAAVDLF